MTKGADGAIYNTVANGNDYADFASNCMFVQDGTGCLGGAGLDITNDGGAEINILDAVGYNVLSNTRSSRFTRTWNSLPPGRRFRPAHRPKAPPSLSGFHSRCVYHVCHSAVPFYIAPHPRKLRAIEITGRDSNPAPCCRCGADA